jgi:hypothetical protein
VRNPRAFGSCKRRSAMHALRLVPVFFFSFLLVGQILPLPSQATHKKPCCTCSYPCAMTCTCRGTNYHCPTCPGGRSAESLNILAGISPVDIRAVRVPDESGRLAHLTKVGDCARRSFELRILGEATESLKLEVFGQDDENSHEEIVTRQLVVERAQ